MADVLPFLPAENPLAHYLNGLDSDESRRTMAGCIRGMQEMLGHPLHAMVPFEVGYLRTELRRRYQPATGNKYLSALRGYLKVAHRMGLVVHELTMRELEEAGNFKGTRVTKGRMLTPEEISGMLRLCPQEEALGARDGALLAVLRAGLRRAEAAGLDMAALEFTAPNSALRVVGKGDKERLVPLPHGAERLILCWLVHRGTGPGPLLARTDVLPRLERLSTQTIYERVQDLWTRSGGLEVAKPSPHDFRRTLASELLDLGVDPHTVQEILGHSMLETTMRYDRRPEGRKSQAMELVVMPGGEEVVADDLEQPVPPEEVQER